MSRRGSCDVEFSGILPERPPISDYIKLPLDLRPSICHSGQIQANLVPYARPRACGYEVDRMDIDRFEHSGNLMPYHGQLQSNESREQRKHLEGGSDVYSSDNAWPYSTRYRPSSSSSLSSSTTGRAPENSGHRPTSLTSPESSVDCQSLAFWDTRQIADKPVRKDSNRKEESRKAHKESERDRRNIENACIQQLKSLTHSECYVNVRSKYRDEPAKNEILARANAFIMALVLRLNAELSYSMALEQQIVDLERDPTASRPKSDTHSLHLHERHPEQHTNHSNFPKPDHPEPSPRDIPVHPSAHPPLPTPHHCKAAHCHYSIPHFEAWYDSALCRRWLDGPDGVLARTLDIVSVWHDGVATIIRSFEKIQAAHPKIVPWNASALVGAFTRIQARAPGAEAADADALVRRFEKTLAAKFAAEPSSVEALVNALDGVGARPASGGL
ncbi:hypothetical protein MMC17_003332 [Xylographa soralifera]|nr:hypothetical protein [Xylographa soralifera]